MMAARNLSEKQLNFARFSIVCVDIIKLPLIDILNIYIKPSELEKKIKGCQSLLIGEYKLNSDQQKKCCYNSSKVPDYSEFDVTLLYKFIRNLCPTLEPTNKWGNKPTKNDVCVGDDIERIRVLRNAYFAHSVVAEISDDDFKELWNDAKCMIHRCQQFTTSKGCQTDYNQMIIDLGRNTLTFNEYISLKERSGVIYILGDTEVLCGRTACFEAEIKLEQDVYLPVSWDKVDGLVRKQIDTASDKYRGSDSRQLLIQCVCKDDEAGYQAVISRNQDVRIFSNKVNLRAIGGPPCLEELKVTTKQGNIYIHYVVQVSENSPIVKDIKWTKNAWKLELPNDKYRGGGLADNCLKILSPGEEDKGEYTCTVSNAVGSFSKSVKLDIPRAEIQSTTNLKVIFGSDTRFDCNVSGYPPPDNVEWQNSLDGTTFHPINIDGDEYFGSSSGPCSLFLLVRNANFEDQQYYRVVVSNAIGECISHNIFLQVTGDRPNMSEGTSILLGHSVKLKFEIFLYYESPAVTDVYWTKNGNKISISTRSEKYSGVDINDPSLTIKNVNCNDAGEYQLTAINAVGETKSELIVLGVPAVYLEEYEKKEDESLCLTMTIRSIPVPHFVQWSMKGNDSETFLPININAGEYRGTSNSFPNPVLVIKHIGRLQNCSFEIEVKNHIGEVKARIPELMKRDRTAVGKFYTDSRSRLLFGKLFAELAKNFPTEKIDQLKHLIQFSCNIEGVTELERAKSAGDCFMILCKEGIFTPSDVIAMQFLLQETKCEDLEKECVKYAKIKNAMYYYETPSENGYQNVHFHVDANLHSFTVEDETKIRETVAYIVGCSIDEIKVHGYLRSASFFLVLSIKGTHIERLIAMKQHDKDKLSKLNIDYFKDEVNTISLNRTKDVKDEHKTTFPEQKDGLKLSTMRSKLKMNKSQLMLKSEILVRKKLEEIEFKLDELTSLRRYIAWENNGENANLISVLEAKNSEKEEKLKNLYWYQYWAKWSLSTEISQLQKRIKDLKFLEERERELENLEQGLHDIPGQGWGEYPGTLDDKIVQENRAKFLTLSVPLTQEVPFINIIMIGETGSGKSSFLRTFTTALMSNTDIKDNYRVGPKEGRELSVTKRIHLEPIRGDKGQQLPCRFYDVPGIEQKKILKDEELQDLQEIIDGKMILDVDVQSDSDNQDAGSLVEAHCILYVIHSKTDLKNKPPSLEAMTRIKKSRNEEDGIRQFVVITAIDQLGVPNDDMKNAYSYGCVRDYCEKVSVEFGVDLLHVIPVSNYFEEVASNDAKNAMSLFNLWRVFKSGKEYIERRWNRKETRFFKKGRKWTSE